MLEELYWAARSRELEAESEKLRLEGVVAVGAKRQRREAPARPIRLVQSALAQR